MAKPGEQKPFNRMISFVGMKMETLERCYSDDPVGDTPRKWHREYPEAEWKIYNEISQTLTLVQMVEPEVRAIIARRLNHTKRQNGGHNAATRNQAEQR